MTTKWYWRKAYFYGNSSFKYFYSFLAICFNLEAKTESFDIFLKNYFCNHCVNSVRIRSFSGLYFPAFGLNTEIYSVNLHIHSECGKLQTRKTPNTDTFYAMITKIYILLKNKENLSVI